MATGILLTSATARSRIDETPEQIKKRYGQGEEKAPRFPSYREIKYSKDGYTIFVHFINGKSAKEQFKKDIGGKWSDKEIAAFLKNFSAGEPWTHSPRERIWYRDNKKLVARRESGHDDWLWIEKRDVTKQFDPDKTLGF
jgi:hypothetical protein